ncbi:MAG: DsbA family oxidoreductase [Jatrophihabitans sp.]
MKVEIWSDVVCPWCYIGKRRFETALARFAHRDEVQVTWRSFELDPNARPSVDDATYAERLGRKYGKSSGEAQQMLDSMTSTAADEGLDFHFEKAVHVNTFAAHQLIHLGATAGVQDAVKERLMRAYFTEGADVSDAATLIRLGGEAGLAAQDVQAALTDARYADAVRADESDATAIGISGVPFFVIDRTYGVSGAQSPETLLGVLQKAWADAHPMTLVSAGPDGDSCGPEGCSV